jgi:hypothetical protein
MLRVSLPVGVVGFFLVQPSRVTEHDAGQFRRVRGAVHGSAEAVPDESRQVPDVIEVGVCDDDGVDRRGVDRKRRPVAQAQLLLALEQAAVDEHAATAGVEQKPAARDGASASEEPKYRAGCCGSGGLRRAANRVRTSRGPERRGGRSVPLR